MELKDKVSNEVMNYYRKAKRKAVNGVCLALGGVKMMSVETST